MRLCPTLHGPGEIEVGAFASPAALPWTLTLEQCDGKFNDKDRPGYNPNYHWGDDDIKIGHQGIDIGGRSGSPLTAMANGYVAAVDLDPYAGNTAAGVWLATISRCPECGGWFCFRHLHCKIGSVLVKVGQYVARGQQLASIGNTGANWYHTHTDLLHSNDPRANLAGSFGPSWGTPYDPIVWGVDKVPPSQLPVPAPTPTPPVTEDTMFCKMYDNSPTVKYWQLRLNRLGANLIVDSKYGPMTQVAVVKYAGGDGLQVGPGEADKIEALIALVAGVLPPGSYLPPGQYTITLKP